MNFSIAKNGSAQLRILEQLRLKGRKRDWQTPSPRSEDRHSDRAGPSALMVVRPDSPACGTGLTRDDHD